MWEIMTERQCPAKKLESAVKGSSNDASSDDTLSCWSTGARDNSIPSHVLVFGNSGSSITLLNQPKGSSGPGELQEIGRKHGEDNAYDDVETAWFLKSDQNCEQEHLKFSSMAPATSGNLIPATLAGNSAAFTSYPCSEPFFRGNSPEYGKTWVNSDFHGPQYSRMALPLELAEEPVYVNAKQYRGILRRRQLRAKAELENKVGKSRKPYLHESRHLHAMRRARGCGGRFLSKSTHNNKLDNNSDSENRIDCNASHPVDMHISAGFLQGTVPISSENIHVPLAGCNEVKGLPSREMQNKEDNIVQLMGLPFPARSSFVPHMHLQA